MEPELKKNSKKKIIIIAAIVAAIALAVGIGVVAFSDNPSKRLQEQLDLGARYLSELDYEQAIAAYEAALEIDPKSAEAYGGLVAAYGEQKDMAAVAEVYARATKALDGTELAALSQKIAEMSVDYADKLFRDGRCDEAIHILESMDTAISSEMLREKTRQIEKMIADETLAWELPLYRFIMEGGYLRAGQAYDGVLNESESYGPPGFALHDLNRICDKVPELSVFNNCETIAGMEYNIYCAREGQFVFLDGANGIYTGHTISDDPQYAGIFSSGAFGGYCWTDYMIIDEKGVLQNETVSLCTLPERNDAGEFVFEELERTSDSSLYEVFERMDGREGIVHRGEILPYYTIPDIRIMGWETFLETYGFKSYLFSELQSVPVDSLPEKLDAFLSDFGWYSHASEYNHESPENLYYFYAFFFGNEYLSLENVYPDLLDIETRDFSHRIMDAGEADRVLKNIYNWDNALIGSIKNDGVSEWFTYSDGKYYGTGAGVGGGYLADIRKAVFDGERYYIEYELFADGFNMGWISEGTHYAEMGYKQIDGNCYWSIYRDSTRPFGAFLEQIAGGAGSAFGAIFSACCT